VRVALCHGGHSYVDEALTLEAGSHVVIATPGRLRDHLEHERITLAAVQYAHWPLGSACAWLRRVN
jgi:ATP-dependent RNA helicase DeaD